MEVLRSKITQNHDTQVKSEMQTDGLYSANGFFFQQRRGNLDLRGISNIDLEKLVREVDVDSLQLHIENITFCNLREDDLRYLTDPQVIKLFKISQLMIEYLLYSQDLFISNLGNLSKKYVAKKKSLAKKRRELEELEETTKHLRNQVKAKKQNITTLEDLLRENSRNKENVTPREPRRNENRSEPEPTARPSSNKVKLFVAGPDGLCVEFNQRFDSTIGALRKEVRQAFVSRKDEEEGGRRLVKLVHRGKILKDEQTVEECEMQTGDTVLLILDSDPTPVTVLTPAPVNNNNNGNLTEMIEFLSKQQDAMREFAHDIKHGWENALQTLAAGRKDDQSSQNNEEKLLGKIDEKWRNFQTDIQAQLEAQRQHQMDLLSLQKEREDARLRVSVTRRRGNAGDLQSDTDENPVLDEINRKLGKIQGDVSGLDEKSVVTDRSINELRESIKNQPKQVQYIPQNNTNTNTHEIIRYEPAPISVPKAVKVVKDTSPHEIPLKPQFNKWNLAPQQVDDRVGSEIVQSVRESIEIGEMILEPKVKVIEPEVKTTPVKVEVPKVFTPPPQKEVKKESPPKVITPAPQNKVVAKKKESPVAVPKTVEIPFPLKYNEDIAKQLKLNEANATAAAKREGRNTPGTAKSSSSSASSSVFTVELDASTSPDDVVLFLRRAIAEKTGVTLSRIILSLLGRDISLDLDDDDEGDGDDASRLTVGKAREHAEKGELVASFKNAKIVTDSQLDLMTHAYEKSLRENLESESSKSGAFGASIDSPTHSTASGTSGKLVPFGQKKFKQRRDWDEGDANEKKDREVYSAMRSSMDEALTSLSDMDRMTDDELREKRKTLSAIQDSLPAEYSDHIKTYRNKVVETVASVTMDSASESELVQRESMSYKSRASTPTPMMSVRSSVSDGAGGRGNVSSSMTLSRGRSGAFGLFDGEVNSSGVLRRSVTDYDKEENHAGHIYNSASDRDDDLPNQASLRPTGGGRQNSAFRRAESKSDSVDFTRNNALQLSDFKADFPSNYPPKRSESKSDSPLPVKKVVAKSPPSAASKTATDSETKKTFSGPPVLEGKGKKPFGGPPPKLTKDIPAVDLESSTRTEDSLAFTNDSLGYSDTLVYSPNHSGLVPGSQGSRAATRYSNESNRQGGGGKGSGGRYGGSGGLDEDDYSDVDRSTDRVEGFDNDDEDEDESYIRRPAVQSRPKTSSGGASGRDRDAVERSMLSSVGRDENDRSDDDEEGHSRYLNQDSIDLSQTAENDGIYAFNDDHHDAVGHADIQGQRAGIGATKSRGRLPSDSILTTPDKGGRDSPASRRKIEQRTMSNLSKLSRPDSLFDGLRPNDDGSDGENSLALSESNNFSDDEDYSRR